MTSSLVGSEMCIRDSYKRQDVDFESALKRELGSSKYIPLDKKVRGLNSVSYTHLTLPTN
eukprot:5689055-Prorocentrum_lima.AAC.1